MDYKDEMRKLIDIVKKISFEAPLEQSLDDLLMLTTASKDLSDRIEMRVRKNMVSSDNGKGKEIVNTVKKKKNKAPAPKPKTPQSYNLPTKQQPTSTAISQADINNNVRDSLGQQRSLAPINPLAPNSPS